MAEFDINHPDFHTDQEQLEVERNMPARPIPPGYLEYQAKRIAETERLRGVIERHHKKLSKIPGFISTGIGISGITLFIKPDSEANEVLEKDWRVGEIPLTLEGNPVTVVREERRGRVLVGCSATT